MIKTNGKGIAGLVGQTIGGRFLVDRQLGQGN